MAQQVLVVEERAPVLEVLRRHLDETGFKLDVVSPSEALERLHPGSHALTIVGFVDGHASDIVAALKGIDPTLPAVALFAEGGDAASEALVADGLLVEPLSGPVVVSCCRAMARMAAQARRIADLERSVPRSGGGAFYDYEFFKKLLLMEVKRSRRYRYPISLALVGVDHWKEISTPLRGSARAELLGGVLQVIARAIRDIDLPLLYSRDRLLVFMPHTGSQGAIQVAGRLCHRVHSQKKDTPLTVSAGVASFEGQGMVSFALLTRQATQALHQAQVEGGNRAVRLGPTPKRNRIVIG